jgi:hypothetical protein
MYKNHYGWFNRVGTGSYSITEKGYAALEEFEEVLYMMLRNKKL